MFQRLQQQWRRIFFSPLLFKCINYAKICSAFVLLRMSFGNSAPLFSCPCFSAPSSLYFHLLTPWKNAVKAVVYCAVKLLTDLPPLATQVYKASKGSRKWRERQKIKTFAWPLMEIECSFVSSRDSSPLVLSCSSFGLCSKGKQPSQHSSTHGFCP